MSRAAIILSSVSFLCLAAVGCAASDSDTVDVAEENRFAPAGAAAEQSDCFNARTINGFSEVDRDTVRVRVGQDRYYDLTVTATCFDLEWADRVAIVSRNGNFMCVGPALGDGAVVTRDDSCSILNIAHSPRLPANQAELMTPFTVAED